MDPLYPQRPSAPEVPSGLSDREQELAKWNRPYVYREFPKMLYRGRTTAAGRVVLDERIVGTELEEAEAVGVGWCLRQEDALARETQRQEDLGTWAAERAYDDRRMSPGAQAEAAWVDQARLRHQPEIPAGPKRSHRRKASA